MFNSNKKTPTTSSDVKNVETLLGKTTSLKGSMVSEGSIRIEGVFEGDISAKGDIFVGPGSKVTAEISGRNVTISGSVIGNVKVSEKLELLMGANLIGDIEVKKLMIEEGAIFKGKSETKNSSEKFAVLSPAPSPVVAK